MPAHNEEGYLEGSVRSVVTGLRQREADFEVIVVENGSKDATGLEARDLASKLAEVRVLELDVADYGTALRTGFLDATGETVVNFDVDLVDLGFMDAALELMADPSVVIVIGSKRSPGSEDRRRAARRIVTWAFSAVLRHGFGLKASDTHGLKALRRQPLVPIVERCRSGSDIFDTELVLRAERAGLSLREVPVTVSDLRPPRTAIASRIPRTLVGLGALWLSMRRDP
jgi:glycosyltransferase involved in cell wall biosynthesis